MVLKKIYFFILLSIVTIQLYAKPSDGIEGYKVSPISINNNFEFLLEEEILEVKGVQIHTTYNFKFNKENEQILAEICFFGDGATGSFAEDSPIPRELRVYIDGKEIEYKIYYENQEIDQIINNNAFDKRIPGKINFSFISKNKNKIELFYLNDPIQNTHYSQIKYTYYSDINNKNSKYKLVLLNDGNGKIVSLNENILPKRISSNRCEIEFGKEDFKSFQKNNNTDFIISLRISNFGIDEDSVFYFNDYDKELFDKRLLITLTKEQLRILRNMFYAKHGYSFKDNNLLEYFKNIPDFNYQINPNFSESDFNEIERKNIELIREMENLKEPILLSDYLNENQQ